MADAALKRELRVTEGRLRRALLRFVSLRVSEQIVEELVTEPVDPQDIVLTDEDRVRLAREMSMKKARRRKK